MRPHIRFNDYRGERETIALHPDAKAVVQWYLMGLAPRGMGYSELLMDAIALRRLIASRWDRFEAFMDAEIVQQLEPLVSEEPQGRTADDWEQVVATYLAIGRFTPDLHHPERQGDDGS